MGRESLSADAVDRRAASKMPQMQKLGSKLRPPAPRHPQQQAPEKGSFIIPRIGILAGAFVLFLIVAIAGFFFIKSRLLKLPDTHNRAVNRPVAPEPQATAPVRATPRQKEHAVTTKGRVEVGISEAEAGAETKQAVAKQAKFGIIFETPVTGKNFALIIDDQKVVDMEYQTGQGMYRWTKGFQVAPGSHKLRFAVNQADGKVLSQLWDHNFQQHQVPVWKLYLEEFPRQLTIKKVQ